jgi:hypothetical protein
MSDRRRAAPSSEVTPLNATHEPMGGLPRIAFKLRTEGVGWITKRLAAEASDPTTRPGQALHFLARRTFSAAALIPRQLRRSLYGQNAQARETLYAFYDLKVSPITFDFLWFLAGAELHRRRLGLNHVHVVIVPGPHEGGRRERDDYEQVVDPVERRARVFNVLMQACPLLPSCTGVTLASSRAEAAVLQTMVASHLFPAGYETALPVFSGSRTCLQAVAGGDGPVPVLRATPERLADIERWAARQAGNRRIVTITLRSYSYMPARNSNPAAWAAFARSLDPDRYWPVIVPDLEEAVEGLPPEFEGLFRFPEAAWHVGLRMALYERAYLNIGVNTGPMGLCWLNERTRYATLKMKAEGVPQMTPDNYRALGFAPGEQLPFATPVQKLVWADDTPETIKATFDEMIRSIESEGRRPYGSG